MVWTSTCRFFQIEGYRGGLAHSISGGVGIGASPANGEMITRNCVLPILNLELLSRAESSGKLDHSTVIGLQMIHPISTRSLE